MRTHKRLPLHLLFMKPHLLLKHRYQMPRILHLSLKKLHLPQTYKYLKRKRKYKHLIHLLLKYQYLWKNKYFPPK